MKKSVKKYIFSSAMDMVELAKEVQSHVYWNHEFYLPEVDDVGVDYKYIWDYIENAINQGANHMTIDSSHRVKFYK